MTLKLSEQVQQKQQPVVSSASKPADTSQQSVMLSAVNTIVEIDAWMTEVGAAEKIKKYEASKKIVSAYVAEMDMPAGETVTVKGTTGSLVYSARANQTQVTDMKALAEKLGDAFWKIVKVNMGDLDKYLSTTEKLEYTQTTQTGSRSLKDVIQATK